jgi:AcrR family transcriptional regulator
MTHPGLLYYFGTKERLLQEAVAARETREAAYLGSLGADASVFRLDEVARFALDAALLTRLYHVLATENLDPGDPLHAFFVTRYDKARRAVVAVLRKDQARGDVRADIDLDQVGYEVLGMLMGLEIQWLMDPDRVDLVGVMQGYVEGLRARLAP